VIAAMTVAVAVFQAAKAVPTPCATPSVIRMQADCLASIAECMIPLVIIQDDGAKLFFELSL
jgi:hypothetical protein